MSGEWRVSFFLGQNAVKIFQRARGRPSDESELGGWTRPGCLHGLRAYAAHPDAFTLYDFAATRSLAESSTRPKASLASHMAPTRSRTSLHRLEQMRVEPAHRQPLRTGAQLQVQAP